MPITNEPIPEVLELSQVPVVAFPLQFEQINIAPFVTVPGRLVNVTVFKIGDESVGPVASTAFPVPVTVVQSITPAVELFSR